MYYYLTASYNTHDLALDEHSFLSVGYETADKRNDALHADLSMRDLETDEIVSVTCLKVENGTIVKEQSFVAADTYNTGDDDEVELGGDRGDESEDD